MQQVRKKTVWSDEALDSFLMICLHPVKTKSACAVALAMRGRRKAELCRFKVDDFKMKTSCAAGHCIRPASLFKRRGFGLVKYIYCYTLAKKFKPYFDAWMAERQKLGIECEVAFSPPVLQVSR